MTVHVHPDQVTWHAVTRFCQRVLDVAPIKGIQDPWREAQTHAAMVGLDADRVKALILTDKVKAELLLGRDIIRTDLCVFIVHGGCIVTVIVGDTYRKPKKRLVVRTNKEHRREIQKWTRRS